MKLNYKRTVLVGFAFFLICLFWQAYDSVIPLILTFFTMLLVRHGDAKPAEKQSVLEHFDVED